MKILEVGIGDSLGCLLATPILQANGRKLLAKGHRVAADDLAQLKRLAIQSLWVVNLDDGDVGEDEGALAIGGAIARGSVRLQQEAGGRVGVLATETAAIQIGPDALRKINSSGVGVVATVAPWSLVSASQRIATIKSQPFAIERARLAPCLEAATEEDVVITAWPVSRPVRCGILFADPVQPERARELLGPVMQQRVLRHGLAPATASVQEEVEPLVRGLRTQLSAQPRFILIASTSAPSGPEDAIGRAMTAVGARIESFMAPVDPGVLLLLGYHDQTPILSAPSCFRSAKINVVDLILPPLMAGYPISAMDIAGMGAGGLLESASQAGR